MSREGVDVANTQPPYRHGGNPQADMARLDVPGKKVLDFSVNLNFLGPPPAARERWKDILEAVESYPSTEGDAIGRYYGKKFGIAPGNFLAGNGSTEMIYLAPRALHFRNVVVITPSYHDYERASILAGAHVIRYPVSADNGFSLSDIDGLIDVLENAEALWVGSPNNPTGVLFPKEFFLELAVRFPDKWFLVDEAFIQFAERWEESSLLIETERPDNLLVIHSLTKFYAIAGLRMGGVVGSEGAIVRLREAKEPWTVNGIAEKMALLLMECGDYDDRARLDHAVERKRIFRRLDALDGITSFDSNANFILCQWNKTENLDDLMRHLLKYGAYVRDCRNFPGLEENFFRVGLRTHGENDQLLSILASS